MGTILQYSHTSDTPFDFNDKNTKAGFHRLGTENSFKNAPSGVNPVYSNVLVVRNNAWDTLSMTIYLYTKGTNSSVVYKTGNTTDWANLSWSVYATKSDLSNFQFISANNFDDAWNKAAKNTMCFADITGNTGAPTQAANRWFAQIFKNDAEKYGWITTWSFTGGVYKKERNNSSSWTDWHS